MVVTAERIAVVREKVYLNPTEAALLTNKSKNTIYSAIYSGELDALRHGQRYVIRREDLDEWMEWLGACAK